MLKWNFDLCVKEALFCLLIQSHVCSRVLKQNVILKMLPLYILCNRNIFF